jgi:IgGFc binding protein
MLSGVFKGGVFFASCLALVLAACGDDVTIFGPKGSGGAGAVGGGGATSTTTNVGPGGMGGGGSGGFGAQGGGGSRECDAFSCSDDLHDIVCDDGMLLLHCPDDQGCVEGSDFCVPACEAAAESGRAMGCDFYAVTPGPMSDLAGGCFAALVVNVWSVPVSITASHGPVSQSGAVIARVPSGSGPGVSYQPLPNGQLDPGQVAVVFLARDPNALGSAALPCPQGVTPLVSGPTAIAGTGYGSAFHLVTDRPVVAFDAFPYGTGNFGGGATLLQPTPAWRDNYVAVDAYDADPFLAQYQGFPFVQLVGLQNGTTVTLLPSAAIVGGNAVPPAPANQPVTYALDAGQVLQLMQPARLVGTVVQADAAVGLWGGSSCMNVPVGTGFCDAGHAALAPVQALGSTYVAVQHRPRDNGPEESTRWQLVGVVDGTTLSYDPMVPGAPLALDRGQKVELTTALQFRVASQDGQHPFFLAGHMTGGSTHMNLGDPEFVPLPPVEQWIRSYHFTTDPTYTNAHLVVVRRRAADATFKDVTVDCAGVVGGWQPVGAGGDYERTRVDLVVNGTGAGGCNNGVHEASSTEPFALVVWGYMDFTSYGYPAGSGVGAVNGVVVTPTP